MAGKRAAILPTDMLPVPRVAVAHCTLPGPRMSHARRTGLAAFPDVVSHALDQKGVNRVSKDLYYTQLRIP
ncbi:hypothetical protein BD413DRAFT_68786 [Trametes elegans]|nr:hypothetical protein BD413DRAFT_68786 [Trametes elegans]